MNESTTWSPGAIGDLRPDGLDDARTLVPPHLGSCEEFGRKVTRDEIGVAHPDRHHAHQYLVVARLTQFNRLHAKRSMAGAKHSCSDLHVDLPRKRVGQY